MPFCEQCGVEMETGSRFCTACGAGAGESHRGNVEKAGKRTAGKERAGRASAEPAGAGEMIWSAKMPIATSSIVMKQLIMVLSVGFGFVALIILLADASAFLAVLPPLLGTYLFILALGVGIAVVLQAGTRGGLEAEFAITPKGVGYRAGETSRAINRATLAGSAAGGSLAGTGGSMVNISREMEFMEWKEMRSVTVHERERGFVFTRKAFIFPIGIWCTKENFEEARALVRQYAPDLPVKMKRW